VNGRAALLAWMLGLLAGVPLSTPAAEPAAEPAAREEPAPVPTYEILARADADDTFAAGVIRRSGSRDPAPGLQRQLDEIAESVDRKHLLLTSEQLRRLSVMRLESLARHWAFDVRRHDNWQRDLRLAFASTNDDAAEIATRRAEWEATRQSPDAATLPDAMRDRIPTVIESLTRAEEALSPRLATQVALGRRGGALRERIQQGRDEVTAAIDAVDRRLLRSDAPPLWVQEPETEDQEAFQHLLQGIAMEARFARDYARFDTFSRANRTLEVLLLPWLLWMSARSRRSPPPAAEHRDAWHALQRPWSAWLLLVMMLVLTLETDAPLLVRQLVMVVGLVPVLRQLTPEFRARFAPWPWVVTGLYLLNMLSFLLTSNPRLYRLYGLGISLAAAVVVATLLMRARARLPRPEDGAVRVMRGAGWVAVVLFALASMSNVLGNISLAEMLTGGTLDSAYLALALYAGQALVTGLLQTLLASSMLPRIIRSHAQSLERLAVRLLRIAAIAGWLLYTLESFRVLRPAYRVAKGILSRTLDVGTLSISLGHIVVFAAAVFISYWTARLVRLLLEDEVLSRMSLPRGVANTVASLTYYALLMVGWLFALSAAGLQLSQLSLLLGALGVGIGFGLQNIVNHFVSGLILMFERPLQPGDIVEIGENSGRVREIGMRATTIHTFEGADVVVPNGTVLSASLRNWSLSDRRRRVQIEVSVAHGVEPPKVMQVLRGAIDATTGLSRNPAPAVQFTGFGPISLDFEVTAWAPDFDSSGGLRSELASRIYAALDEAGIQIPVPRQELHLRTQPDALKPVPPPPAPR